MEGPLLAEFSGLNALSSQRAPGHAAPSRAPHSARAPSGSDRSRANEDLAHKERLLRGEALYTGSSSDGRPTEQFIEDQPQSVQLGVSSVLPKAATSEERERLLRRLEMCAKAREQSAKIMSIKFAERDALKNDMRRQRELYQEKLSTSQRDRAERWSRRMQRSPFAVDLLAENQRIDEENRVQRTVEQRRQRAIALQKKEAHNSIFKRATAESDELEKLRAEKRTLLENERQLKALKDVEKSNARTAQILQERSRRYLERESQQSMMRLSSDRIPDWPTSARSAF